MGTGPTRLDEETAAEAALTEARKLEWGDDLDRTSFKGDPELRRRLVRGTILLLAVVLVAVLAWAGWRSVRSHCQPLLTDARLLVRLLKAEPMNFQAHYTLGQAYAREGQREPAQHHLAMHKRILDTRVRIHSLERRADRNARDTEARAELIRLYEELGMTEHADFWRRTTASIGDG